MSAFRDLALDFPSRCGEILQFAYPQAEHRDREVTLLLMTAAAALVIPYERLSPSHPGSDGRDFPALVKRLDHLRGGSFLESPFAGPQPSSWGRGDIALGDLQKGPDSWPELQAGVPLPTEVRCSQVLSCIRNALAHGNLYFLSGSQIDEIVFVAGRLDRSADKRVLVGYQFVRVGVRDFKHFLERWFEFLKAHRIPQSAVVLLVDDAA